MLIGSVRRKHFIRYRFVRVPTAILGLAEELGPPAGSGYRVELSCNHFGDTRLLAIQLRSRVRVEISHGYLSKKYGSWRLSSDELRGRLEEDLSDLSAPPRVVVDGRSLSWQEFGELLNPYVGWMVHLRLGEENEASVSDDEARHVGARPPTAAEERAAERAWRKAGGAFHLDSLHYPSPTEWALSHRVD